MNTLQGQGARSLQNDGMWPGSVASPRNFPITSSLRSKCPCNHTGQAFLPDWQLPHGYSTVCRRLTVVWDPNCCPYLRPAGYISTHQPESQIFATLSQNPHNSHGYYTLCNHFVTGLMGVAIGQTRRRLGGQLVPPRECYFNFEFYKWMD